MPIVRLALLVPLLAAASLLRAQDPPSAAWKEMAQARAKKIAEALAPLGGKPEISDAGDVFIVDLTIGESFSDGCLIQAWLYPTPEAARKDWDNSLKSETEPPGRPEKFTLEGEGEQRLHSRPYPPQRGIFESAMGAAFAEALRGDRRLFVMCNRVAKGKRSLDDADAIEKGQDPEVEGLREEAAKEARRILRQILEASGPVELPKDVTLELFDATPAFLELPVTVAPSNFADLAKSSTRRSGCAADGVSALLLHARCARAAAWVTFELEYGASDGRIAPIDERPGSKPKPGPVVSPAWGGSAFAVYWPPADIDLKKQGERPVKVKVSLYGVDAAPPEAQRSPGMPLNPGAQPISTVVHAIRLIRTPLVLMHGTYSDPDDAWIQPFVKGGTGTRELLSRSGFDPSTVDYKATNGSSKGGPSHFWDNEKALAKNPGGIADTLRHFRGGCDRPSCQRKHAGDDTFAVTKVDVVAHSMGGVLSRVYARGFTLRGRENPPREHFDPARTSCEGCWYHRAENRFQGDIRRLITLSTTHNGSDITRVLMAYMSVKDEAIQGPEMSALGFDELITQILLMVADDESGLGTGAFEDQAPFSDPLQRVGRTPVAMHAIACVNTFGDPMEGMHPTDAFYRERLFKIWTGSTPKILALAFTALGQPNDAQELAARKIEELKLTAQIGGTPQDTDRLAQLRYENPKEMAKAVFGHQRNDCTVRIDSSLAGLDAPFTTVVEGVWHSDAPRAPQVQKRIIELLQGPDSAFSPMVPATVDVHAIERQKTGASDDSPPTKR